VWATIVWLSCACWAQGAEPPRLRVLSYNVHACIGTDGRLDVERIAKVIKTCDPDLVAIQELDRKTARTRQIDQPGELGRLTGMHAEFGKTIDYRGGEYGIGILSRFAPERVQMHRLPGSESREQRGALAVMVRPAGLPDVLFICTHLDATADERDSIPQVTELNRLFTGEDQPAIIAGDFNKTPSARTIGIMLDRWVNATAGEDRPTFPSIRPAQQIDFVFYRPGNAWRVVETKVIEEEVASDHRGLLVVLEWTR